ncbi:MAG: helix-turn-helix transcriptional regulator [Pseudorhodoplanes sp.]|uniref:AraC family transcriptional regulator n=1 Tax=Pseudorhodoplanes sp. TaxID=1934341 RepID=UPI003D0DFBC8
MEISYNRIDDLLEAVSQRLISVDFRAIGDAPFHASVKWVVASPEISVMRSRHSPGATFRDHRKVRDGDDSFSLIYPVNSSLRLSHLGNERRVAAGQPIFTRHDAVCEMGAANRCNFVALVMSPSVARSAGLLDSGMIARRLPRSLPALTLLKDYISVLDARDRSLTGEVGCSAARHIGELVRLAVGELTDRQIETDPAAIAVSRLDVALAFLRRDFREPDLSVASMAAAQNISPRYLHRLFEQAGIRFTGQLNELRLTAASEALRQHADKPIALIAMESGFSDIAHFNRLFRKRFGMTPGAMRGRKSEP